MDVFIGRTNCPLCLVVAYIIIRSTAPGPFFRFPYGQTLTKPYYFVTEIRNALQAVGLPYQCFTGHSFQISATTTAAKADLEDSVIRNLGRWKSNAFLSYIKHQKSSWHNMPPSLLTLSLFLCGLLCH